MLDTPVRRCSRRWLLPTAIVVVLLVVGGVVTAAIVLSGPPEATPQDRANRLCLEYRQGLNEQLNQVATGAGPAEQGQQAAFDLFLSETDQLIVDLAGVSPPPPGIDTYLLALRVATERVRADGPASVGQVGKADPFQPALDAARAAGLEGCA
jgi:hypothetical protein